MPAPVGLLRFADFLPELSLLGSQNAPDSEFIRDSHANVRGLSVSHVANALLDKSLAGAIRIEHFFDAELFRTRGECLVTQGDERAAQTWFGRALELAGKQGARLFELRAASSLLRCKPNDRAIARRLRKLKDELGSGICEADVRDASEALATTHS